MKNLKIAIRGAGDLASGIAHRLFQSGFRPVMTELAHPKAVRRTVCFSTAVNDGEIIIEGVRGVKRISIPEEHDEYIPIITDTTDNPFDFSEFHVVIDARMMKDLRKDSFPEGCLRIGIGPGFDAGSDTDIVIETNRGINLGKVIRKGPAEKDTGIPGIIAGKGAERVLRAPDTGFVKSFFKIGDLVDENKIIAEVNGMPVRSPFRGKIRGLISESSYVGKGEKIGDIDARENVNCFVISDKARAIGGGVLEAILSSFSWKADIK